MVHFDFEVLLLGLTAITGVIWLVDSLVFAPRRSREAMSKAAHEPLVTEYSRAFFPVLLLVLLIRSFWIEPFRIPSGSMMPTLLVGDFILVEKYAYGLRFPVWHFKMTSSDGPKRGDVIVFRYPRDESQDYIKRVIGLPGDNIGYYNRRLTVNGTPVETINNGLYPGLGDVNGMRDAGGCDRRGARCEVFFEQIEDLSYTVMTNPGSTYSINGEIVVPEGQYFVMGDNRDHSNDSRVWGFVPEQNLVGKAIRVWLHWDFRSNGTGFDISRIGNKISN